MRRAWLALLFAACAQPAGGIASDGTDAWVDPTLGTDDLAHGGGPGADAWRTITFALAHATSTIHLDAGTYDAASGETFPLVLHGEQVLVGDADLGAKIAGNGPFTPDDPSNPLDSTIVLDGTVDSVTGVDLTTTDANPDWGPACVRIATSGQHVIGGSTLHGCPVAIDFGGHSGATITGVGTGDVSQATAGNCLNQVGDDVSVSDFSCRSSNDWVFVCGAGFTGCGTQVLGRVAACSEDLSSFAAACP